MLEELDNFDEYLKNIDKSIDDTDRFLLKDKSQDELIDIIINLKSNNENLK